MTLIGPFRRGCETRRAPNEEFPALPRHIRSHPVANICRRRSRSPTLARPRCSLYVLTRPRICFFQTSATCLIRSSSRRKPARQRTSAPRLVLAMERYSRPRAIYSIWSSRRMFFPNGSAGQRSCCGPKAFTARARRRAATRPPSSKSFARPFVPPDGFGSPPIAIARVSSSVKRFWSITSTAARSCGCCSPPRTLRPFAPHLIGQGRMPNTPAFTPPPLRAGKPTRSTIYPSPGLQPSCWIGVRAG